MAARKVAVCAVAVALLIALQFTLSMVPGVELVTVFLLCFCYTFGIITGMITATCFSLLRCILFGFYPNVIILYLVYYNLFALLFGALGKRNIPQWLCIFLLSAVAFLSAYCAVAGLPVSVIYMRKITVMLWIIFALSVLILITYSVLVVLKKGREGREIASVTIFAVVCTVCFTLLDDIITPLVAGYTFDAAWAYFIASLYVVIPQSLCAFLSVLVLFAPLVKVFKSVNI